MHHDTERADLLEEQDERQLCYSDGEHEEIRDEDAGVRSWVVAYYRSYQSYGGPEEGGWWYDEGDLIRVTRVFRRKEDAIAYCARLNEKLERWQDRARVPKKWSVISTGRIEAAFYRNTAPAHYPDRRPHYE